MTHARPVGIKVFPAHPSTPLYGDKGEALDIITRLYTPLEVAQEGDIVCVAYERGTKAHLKNGVMRSDQGYLRVILKSHGVLTRKSLRSAVKDDRISRGQLKDIFDADNIVGINACPGMVELEHNMRQDNLNKVDVMTYLTPHGAVSTLEHPFNEYIEICATDLPNSVGVKPHEHAQRQDLVDNLVRLHVDMPQSSHQRIQMQSDLEVLHRFAQSLLRPRSKLVPGIDAIPLNTEAIDR